MIRGLMVTERGRHSETRIEEERGQFVVYLDVWLTDFAGQPTRLESKRITECATRKRAEIMAAFILRGAQRGGPDGPPGPF